MVYATRSYADVGELMHEVMSKVLADGWEPDVIVRVDRGGRVPGSMAIMHANTTCEAFARLVPARASKYDVLGNVMHAVRVDKIRLPRKEASRVLVVDDVLETGDTMRAIVRKLQEHASDIRVAAVFKKSSYVDADVAGCKMYYGEEVDDETWVIPEWEEDEYQRAAHSATTLHKK